MSTSPATTRKWDFDRVFRLLLAVLLAAGLFGLVRYLADVLVPFAVALLLAYLLDPIVKALESRLGRRTPAVLLTVAGCGIVAFAMTVALVALVSREVTSFRGMVQEFHVEGAATSGAGLRAALDEYVARQDNAAYRWVLEETRAGLEKLAAERDALDGGAMVRAALRRLAPGVIGLVSGALSVVFAITGAIVVVVYLVFVLIDFPRLTRSWRGYLPPQYRSDVVAFVDEFATAMSRYFRGQFLIAAGMSVVYMVGFGLIGLRMGIMLGLLVGMLNMVPYLSAAGLVPALFLGLLRAVETGNSVLTTLLLVLLVFGVAQVLQDVVLTPRIMGGTTGLRPVVLMLSVFVWGKLLGFLGLVLAIPLTCLGLAYYRRIVLGDRKATAVPEA